MNSNKLKIIYFLIGTVMFSISCGHSNHESHIKDKNVQEKNEFERSELVDIDSCTESSYALIKEQFKYDGNLYVKVDYVDYLTGELALEAEWRDGAYFVDGTDTISNITDGYYISNVNPKIRTFKITEGAQIENIIDDSGVHKLEEIRPLNSEQVKKYINSNSLIFIRVENGIVKSIDDRFMP